MNNFRVIFDTPWLMLLLIPGIVVALWPYFRLEKKYRRTRYRIISLVLHLTILVFSISVLSGAQLAFKVQNVENELFILVDTSYSTSLAKSDTAIQGILTATEEDDNSNSRKKLMDEFIEKIVDNNKSIYKIGIITFASAPYYASALTYDMDTLLKNYNKAPLPLDDSATNISAALIEARSHITSPKSAKILILSDGIQTDGDAVTTIMGLIAEGVRVDTVLFENNYENEIQVIDIEKPTHNVKAEETVKIGITIQSSYDGEVLLTLSDNGIPNEPISVKVTATKQVVQVEHTFKDLGAHALHVSLETGTGFDTTEQNNNFYSYIFLETYDRILIVDNHDEGRSLRNLLNAGDSNYKEPVQTVNIKDVPNTLEQLSQFDLVILVNIANADMPAGFDDLLFSYVEDLGGGVLTVGGNKVGKTEANAYGIDDMNPGGVPSVYQNMLPVTCVEYWPPVAVMLVIDRSGSMAYTDIDGRTRMDLAKEGAKATIDALSERDFLGVISFSEANKVKVELDLTPIPQRSKIERAIDNMSEPDGGTFFSEALNRAYQILNSAVNVENKHIMLVSDGEPTDSAEKDANGNLGYNHYVSLCVASGITISVVSIISSDLGAETGRAIAKAGKGEAYEVYSGSGLSLAETMKKDLTIDQIREYVPQSFRPVIRDHTSVVSGIDQKDIPLLGGYYGVKEKDSVYVPLMGQYTPIYAQWTLGEGKVGSFMSDLNGTWSGDFMTNTTGVNIIRNIINALLPTSPVAIFDIMPDKITRNNYETILNIKTANLAADEYVEVTVGEVIIEQGMIRDTLSNVKTERADISSGMPKINLTFPKTGIYRIIIEKRTESSLISSYTTHVEFSYSDEYLAYFDEEQLAAHRLFLQNLAGYAGGGLLNVDSPEAVFRDVQKTVDEKVNPKYVLMVMLIILFLIDLAVRKFKFKWPWEIIRDRKIKQDLKRQH